MLVAGGGDRGHFLELKCVPTSTLKGEIDDFIAAGTTVIGKFVSLSFGANYEVDSPAAGAQVDGKIHAVKEDKVNDTYELTCRIWSFTDDQSNRYPAICIVQGPYSGTLVRRNTAECYSGSTFYQFSDGDTTARGNAVIAIDVPASGYCDVIMG